MIGKEIRLKRLFNGGKDNVVIVAVDHGMFQGPRPGFEVLPEVVRKVRTADAILMSPGMVKRCKEVFEDRAAPPLLVRTVYSSAYCFPWDYVEGYNSLACRPKYAAALGADGVLASLQLKTGSEERDSNNAGLFCSIAQEADEAGLPLIGECYPVGAEALTGAQMHDLIKINVRILVELGADVIKTYYTGERYPEIIEATPVPVLALGAAKLETDLQALELAANATRAGARGLVFGRNVALATDPARMIDALKEVVNAGKDPKATAAKFGLK